MKDEKKEAGIVLPKQKVKATETNPRVLVIYSKPKVGKTELTSKLENSLILDLEDGSDYIDAVKIKANNVAEIKAIGEQIKKEKYPYEYLIVDTVTKLEEFCIPYAEKLYSKTLPGKNWFKSTDGKTLDPTSGKARYGDILSLPDGAGYKYLRQAMSNMLNYIGTLAPYIIILAHVKVISLEREGENVSLSDLDLTGKIKNMLSTYSDGIGYMYRSKNKTNILSFESSDDILCGTRSEHIRNKKIVISELIDGELKTYWDKVYI